MAERVAETELDEATRDFEAMLERPIVPGELASWSSTVSQGCSRLAARLRTCLENEHSSLYAVIERQDPGLLHRVDQMRGEDRALIEALAELDEATSQLATDASRSAPREAYLENTRSEIVKRGIDCVVRIRTQEAALQTWYSEAFYRDRGTVD